MADSGTDTRLRDSRPTFCVAGRDESSLAGAVLELANLESTEGLDRCEATFGNWGPRGGGTDFLYFDRQTLEFGKRFQVKLGDGVLFDGRITALEARFP